MRLTGEIVTNEQQIRKTTNYNQFEKIIGNRDVDIAHVNELVARIAQYNMLAQFPIVVTQDGYIVDGQHRLEAARVSKLPIYYVVSEESLESIIVALINSSQLHWRIINFVDFYVQQGNPQYIWLKEIYEDHKISIANLLSLFTGHNKTTVLKRGELQLFRSEEEQDILLDMLAAYLALKDSFTLQVWEDMDFVQALRTMFEQVSAQNIKEELSRYAKPITLQNAKNDYLRLFEGIFNRRKRGKKIRFF